MESSEYCGIIASGVLSGLIVYKTLMKIKCKQIYNYSDFLATINPKHLKTNKAIELIVKSFLLISFVIMISAFSAYILQVYKIQTYISSTIIAVICYFVFKKNLQGMMKINIILVPAILIFILFLGIKNIPWIMETTIKIEERTITNFFISSILYTSYNSIMLIPILIEIKAYITSQKQIKKISIITSLIIIVLSFCIFGLLLRENKYEKNIAIPLIEITKQFGKKYQTTYSFVIIASIFTSIISAGYSFLENVSKSKKEYEINLVLICISSVIISQIGFSKLIEILYPAFGVLGIIQIVFLIKNI